MENRIFLWSDALKIAPDSKRVHLNYGVELLKEGQKEDALHHLEIAYGLKQGENRGTDLLPAYNMAHYYLTEGDLNEAKMLFKEVVRADPSFQAGWYGLSMVALKRNQLDEGEKYIRMSLSPLPVNPSDAAKYHLVLSRILLQKGEMEMALKEALEAAFTSNEFQPALLFTLGEIYRINKKWEKASKFFEKLLKRKPFDLEAIIPLIEIYDHLKEREKLKYWVFIFMAIKKERHIDEVISESYLGRSEEQISGIKEIIERVITTESSNL